jgi:hypothetical protein
MQGGPVRMKSIRNHIFSSLQPNKLDMYCMERRSHINEYKNLTLEVNHVVLGPNTTHRA